MLISNHAPDLQLVERDSVGETCFFNKDILKKGKKQPPTDSPKTIFKESQLIHCERLHILTSSHPTSLRNVFHSIQFSLSLLRAFCKETPYDSLLMINV